MYDPRWDDARERDDGRARVYEERDPADHDPRDGLLRDLDLPRGEARELVVNRDRIYELNGEDSRALAVVGAFRVVPERDFGTDRDDAFDRDTLDQQGAEREMVVLVPRESRQVEHDHEMHAALI